LATTFRTRHLIIATFSARFLVPPEAANAYVIATVDVARQPFTVTLDGTVIAEWPYRLR
jgi:hypothetical protein